MNPTEVTADIRIGGEKRKLYFNFNAYKQFETASSMKDNGKRKTFTEFFLSTMMVVQEASTRAVLATADLRSQMKAAVDAKDQVSAKRIEGVIEEKIKMMLLEGMYEVGMTDILALVYGALHEYDSEDNPRWPLSPGRLGKIFTPAEMQDAFPILADVFNKLKPKATDIADSNKPEAEEPKRPTPAPVILMESNGGSTSGAAVEPLDLLTVRSDV